MAPPSAGAGIEPPQVALAAPTPEPPGLQWLDARKGTPSSLVTEPDALFIGGAFPLGVHGLPNLDLLTNGSFELRDGSSVPTMWWREDDRGTATVVCVAGKRVHRWCALQVEVAEGGWADIGQEVAIRANETYRLDAAVFASNVTAGGHEVAVEWLAESGTVLGGVLASSGAASVWERVSRPGIQPAQGATRARVRIRARAAGSYLFDNVKLSLERTPFALNAELRAAGFNLRTGSVEDLDPLTGSGLQLVTNAPTRLLPTASADALRAVYDAAASHPAFGLWIGPDEPAWEANGAWEMFPAEDLVRGYEVLGGFASGPAPPIWINHAPRGTRDHPEAFDLLQPYLFASDIVSMDIYPVPSGNGHSSLPDQSLSCVGAYVDLLRELSASSGSRRQPIWMVLQAFGWGDLPWRGAHEDHAVEVEWLDGTGAVLGRALAVSDLPNEWREVSVQSLVAPTAATAARVVLRISGPGHVSYDDLSFTGIGSTTNFLHNGALDCAPGGDPTGWSQIGPDALGGCEIHDTGSSVGATLSARGDVRWAQTIPVEPNRRYVLRARIRAVTRPTWHETRFMAYDAIIHGARGLFWWGLHEVPGGIESDLWGDVKRIAAELRSIDTALSSPISTRVVLTDEPSIEAALFDAASGPLLIAANRTATRVHAALRVGGPALTAAQRVFESTPASMITLADSTLEDDFEAYAVRVYRLW